MNKLFFINFIQQRIKFKIYLKRKINNDYHRYYNILQDIIDHNLNNFNLDLINTFTYNNINNKLIDILNIYYKIEEETTINKLVVLNNINNKLVNIIKICGTTIENILLIFYKISINSLFNNGEINNIMKYFNIIYNPISCEIYNKKTSKNNIPNNDIEKLGKINNFLLTKLNKKNLTLLEHINGAKLYIEIKQLNKILILNGYFNNDPLNISRFNPIFKTKNKELIKKVKLINIDKNFKNRYIEQLSIKDFIVLSIDEIILKLTDDYDKVIKFKKQNISTIVKEFLNTSIEKQRIIIILFFIIDDIELQYIGNLLYDMINNDSYLLKSQPLSKQIYNSLHWSIQKYFKNLIKNVNNYKNSIDINIEDLSYEKRIVLMKVPNNIKQKAFSKLKEFNSKTSDNSSKSQYYLDSLLKIPFNIYKEEKILSQLKNLKKNVHDLLDVINNPDLLLYNNTIPLVYSSIDKIIEQLNLKKYKFSTNIDYNTILNEIPLLHKIIHFFVTNTKNKFISQYIKQLNHKFNLILKDKGTKKYYINQFKNILNDVKTDLSVKEKIIFKMYNYDKSNQSTDINNELIYNKINILIQKWYNYRNERRDYILNIDTILDNAIYSQTDAKKEIKRIIGQWINGKMDGYCIGFEGPPGIGKTSLAKKGIANCLIDENGISRPFYFVALGGATNGSVLEGHSYTYVGSTYGKIIEILIETQCMNPIIYIDELDKISNTDNGNEIIGILTHLTDSSQNDEFTDKYFSGMKFDLSKVLFIFSYNDYHKLDSILADRIHRVKFKYLSKIEKIHIMKKYIIPELLEIVGFEINSIKFTDTVLEFIIETYTLEAGIRKLKERVFEIIREINLKSIIDNIPVKNINVTIDYIKQIFDTKSRITYTKINNKNYIGIVNGLFATSVGIGGITIIQAFKTYSEHKFSLMITGQQGDVMKESIQCAKTIAWNILPNTIKKKIKTEWEKNIYGIHIHCPEASTPKDGPSAGGAITLSIISLLCNIKVLNNVAMTGEIDLNGEIHMIGGLDLKIDGGINAGITKFLVPRENEEDLFIIKKEKPYLFENIDIILIDTINDIIFHAFEKNKLFISHNIN